MAKNEGNHFVGHNILSYFMLKVLVACTSMLMTTENAGAMEQQNFGVCRIVQFNFCSFLYTVDFFSPFTFIYKHYYITRNVLHSAWNNEMCRRSQEALH